MLGFGRESAMSNKPAFAAVLRALRLTRGLSQGALADALSAPRLSALESGKSTPSLDRLEALSDLLNISPTAVLALTQAIQSNEPASAILERARLDLIAFEQEGGMDHLSAQLDQGSLVKRSAGKHFDDARHRRVLQCKADGLTQKETATRLGLSTSTVHDLWKRQSPK